MTYSEFKAKYQLELDPQQEAAVRCVEGPVLLLAVPGSGKTTVLVTRLGYMLCGCGVRPERVLTMTYTVSAARDMRERFAARFGGELAERLEFRTINGVCSMIIRCYERMYDRKAFELLEDGGRQAAIIGDICRRTTREFAAESTVKAIQAAITYTKNRMLTAEELEQVEVEGVDFPPIYREYCRVLRAQGLMDYDDQMVYAHQILLKYPEVLRVFRERYPYLCVDEAQDTSKIQHVIIRLLAGGNMNLFMVGDEDQSIYGFRAAYPEALMEFERVYPGAKVLLLERNYRSTRPIVQAADRFIRQNQNRHQKEMKAVRGEGGDIQEISVYDRRAQYRYLARLAENCQRETAVLYRDNDSALPLIDLLDRAGMPYRCRQVDSAFFTHRIVRDITDIIRFARRPDDGETFLRIYYKLGAGISKAAAEEAAARCAREEMTILGYLAEQPGLSPWTKKQCRALQTHMQNLLTEQADRAVYRIVHFMGYGAYLEERGADLNKTQILEALGAGEQTPEGLLERLEELSAVVRSGSSDPECNFILSTIHSSKGLEYDRVILMDVADGILPKVLPSQSGKPSAEELEALEEERRLFYVGMTRAKNELSVFRFRQADLGSSFTKFLFPPKEGTKPEAAGTFKPLPKRKELSSVDVASAARDYGPGTRLVHKKFGGGELTNKVGDIVTVCFDSGEEKKFSLNAALRSRQFKME